MAITLENVAMVRCLLTNGFDPNHPDEVGLKLAVR